MITFSPNDTLPRVSASLVYDKHSLITEPWPAYGGGCIVVNFVELMFDDDDNVVVFVCGYCPQEAWTYAELGEPRRRRSGLVVHLDEPNVPGISRSLTGHAEHWPTAFDPQSGWLRIGKGAAADDLPGIEFGPGAVCVTEGDSGALRALWLHPDRWIGVRPRSLTGAP